MNRNNVMPFHEVDDFNHYISTVFHIPQNLNIFN